MTLYTPDELPLDNIDYNKSLLRLSGDANAALAAYDGLLRSIPNPSIMAQLALQEAVLSSKIEGIQATVYEVLESGAGVPMKEEKAHDIQEITNYRKALYIAEKHLIDSSITLNLTKQLQEVMLNSVRGANTRRGEFRTKQNWFGLPNGKITEATFIPPSSLIVQEHMEKWAKYLARDDEDAILQTAIMHAQFELIHPFEDGNGRVGRILIPLLLCQKKKISTPMFYISAYLEKHRKEYYARLKAISQKKDWNSWINFFLKAVAIQARSNRTKVERIHDCYNDYLEKIQKVTKSQHSAAAVQFFFKNPLFSASTFKEESGIPMQVTQRILRKLKKEKILTELRPARGRKPSLLRFDKLMRIIRSQY